MLANDAAVRRLDISPETFADAAHREAFELLTAAMQPLSPGQPPDLGALLGDDDGERATMLRALALEDRPLADPAEVLRKLQVGALERRIEDMRRALESIDAESEEYSTRFAELIALERERHDLAGQL